MKNYVFPAIFFEEPCGIGVVFPDLPGCVTQDDDYEHAFRCAREALHLHLTGMIEDGEKIPSPSKLAAIPLETGSALALIETQI